MELISKKWLDASRDISPAKYELEKLKNQEKRIEMFLEHKNKDNIKRSCIENKNEE